MFHLFCHYLWFWFIFLFYFFCLFKNILGLILLSSIYCILPFSHICYFLTVRMIFSNCWAKFLLTPIFGFTSINNFILSKLSIGDFKYFSLTYLRFLFFSFYQVFYYSFFDYFLQVFLMSFYKFYFYSFNYFSYFLYWINFFMFLVLSIFIS